MSMDADVFTTRLDWVAAALSVPDEPAWRLEEQGYQAALEHDVESQFAISNGFLGVRGSLEQSTVASRPRTFIAGFFDTLPSDPPIPALVHGPDWLRFDLIVAGERLALERGETLAHGRTLDLRRGVLIGDWRQRDSAGRIVHLEVEQPAPITLEAWFEPPAAGLFLEQADPTLQIWRAAHEPKQLAIASSMALWLGDQRIRPASGDGGRQVWSWHATPDQPAIFVRIVTFARGDVEDDVRATAYAALRRARRNGLRRLLAEHTNAWAERWQASDIVVGGDEAAQRALHFALYHLIGAANPDDSSTSIGARALTGDGYLGHVFWDTEIFLLPYYIYTWPAAAR